MRGLIQGMECLAPACRGANLTPKLFENRPRVIDQKPFVVHDQGTTRHDHLTSQFFPANCLPYFTLKRFNHPTRSRFSVGGYIPITCKFASLIRFAVSAMLECLQLCRHHPALPRRRAGRPSKPARSSRSGRASPLVHPTIGAGNLGRPWLVFKGGGPDSLLCAKGVAIRDQNPPNPSDRVLFPL
jgi:hypothetical protein